ncbi:MULTISPECIES: head-tail connector protein [Actinomycetaceae]|uniref:head-tail connector protein n=1 Tax=Actinomycetaceae TaxID=2049 RepID=UPI0014707D39|nr:MULTISPECIES: head-tail connector protein [Actinomycetaceae]MCM3907913.1 head-tail connector protein [Trueperella bernardiae]MDK8225042.1 head-tail connector protein [Winkia sp. UMB750B]MDK8256496.1 head-tail connector protein [Winkia sp. UMB750A]NMW48046.1 phage gp6-like head-tail connector protein [Mobiluncus curtisii]
MTTTELIDLAKANLLITFDDDDQLIGALVNAATSYACSFQHLPENHYEAHEMSGATRQGIVMLASHFYESRDGSTAGFWADKPDAARAVWNAVNNLLRLDRDWKV